jgi:hypothetical protein
MNNKYFTLDEAKSTLPYVSLITYDIIIKRAEMVRLKQEIKRIIYPSKTGGIWQDIFAEELKAISKEISYHLEELESVGCYLKDFELGLVDFPSVINNKVVFLTYQYGEKEINYWHSLTESVESRKLINLDKNLDKLTIFNN